MMFKLLNRIERTAARLQGKGYGTGSIVSEVKAVRQLHNNEPFRLAVDIGANVGNYTTELLRHNPAMEIHLFEPAQVNIMALEARFGGQQNLFIIPKAVANQNGQAILHANVAGSGLGSLTKRRLDHFDISFEFIEEVPTVLFSDYWRDVLRCRPIDLVKIDIEGHELNALEGFGQAMEHTSIIQFEFGGCNIDTRSYFQDFWYFFKKHGFSVYRITPLGIQSIQAYQETEEYFSTTNYIACQTRYIK